MILKKVSKKNSIFKNQKIKNQFKKNYHKFK